MKKIKFNIYSSLGRNRGRISTFHRERGRKKMYRLIDFFFNLSGSEGYIVSIEHDSYRKGFVALVYYLGGVVSYILCADGLKIGDKVVVQGIMLSGDDVQLRIGSAYSLRLLPVGSKIFNLEYLPGKGSQISRSAGNFCVIIKKYSDTCLIKLCSGEYRLFLLDCYCVLGRVSNIYAKNRNLGKAGLNRMLGKRPIVRGQAMNPIDHPHGGRTNGGIPRKTPWGKLAKGIKTRKLNRNNNLILKSRLK